MFRIPGRFLDVDTARVYCDGEVVSLTAEKEHVVLEFSSQDEEGDGWTEGEHWMPSLISIRDELMRGDLRALYLSWLASFLERGWDDDGANDEEREPPVPPGLRKLSASQRALADFLRIDEELLEVAADGSYGEPAAAPSRAEMARWVEALPAGEKGAYLVRFLAEDGDVRLRAELSKQFREASSPRGTGLISATERRTVAQLREARDALVQEKCRKASQKAARERSRREREQAEERAKYLDELARHEPATWREVEQLIASKRPKDYDRPVSLLVELRDLAELSRRTEEAAKRIRELRGRHSNKPSLLKLFQDKKLGR